MPVEIRCIALQNLVPLLRRSAQSLSSAQQRTELWEARPRRDVGPLVSFSPVRQPTLLMVLLVAGGGPSCGLVVDAEGYVDGKSDPGRARIALLGGVRQPKFGDAAVTSEVLVGLVGDAGEIERYLPMDALPRPGVFAGHSGSSGVTALTNSGEQGLLLARAEHAGAGLGPWSTLGVMSAPGQQEPMIAMASENLFAVLGGHADGGDGVASVQMGHAADAGVVFPDLGPRQMVRPRWHSAIGTCGGSLYVVGGLSGGSGAPITLDSVELARVEADSLGPFTETLPMSAAGQPHAVSGAALACGSSMLFVVGGNRERGVNQTLSTVLAGRIEATGQISSWTELEPLPVPLSNAAAALGGGRLWVVGGTLDTGRSDRVHSAAFEGDRLGQWTSSTPGVLPDGRSETGVLTL